MWKFNPFTGELDYAATGTGLVPYTGAVYNVHLGDHTIITNGLVVDGLVPDEPDVTGACFSVWFGEDFFGTMMMSVDWTTWESYPMLFDGDDMVFGFFSGADTFFCGKTEFYNDVLIEANLDIWYKFSTFGAIYNEPTIINYTPYFVDTYKSNIYVDATVESIIVNLPPAVGSGRLLLIKKIAGAIGNTVIIVADNTGVADMIDGTGTVVLSTLYASVNIHDVEENNWYIN